MHKCDPMNFNISTVGSTATVYVQGKFDGTIRKDFNDAIREAIRYPSATHIEVHLGSVHYIDSAACGMLLLLKAQAEAVGKSVFLSNAKGSVKQVLDVMNFHKLFQMA